MLESSKPLIRESDSKKNGKSSFAAPISSGSSIPKKLAFKFKTPFISVGFGSRFKRSCVVVNPSRTAAPAAKSLARRPMQCLKNCARTMWNHLLFSKSKNPEQSARILSSASNLAFPKQGGEREFTSTEALEPESQTHTLPGLADLAAAHQTNVSNSNLCIQESNSPITSKTSSSTVNAPARFTDVRPLLATPSHDSSLRASNSFKAQSLSHQPGVLAKDYAFTSSPTGSPRQFPCKLSKELVKSASSASLRTLEQLTTLEGSHKALIVGLTRTESPLPLQYLRRRLLSNNSSSLRESIVASALCENCCNSFSQAGHACTVFQTSPHTPPISDSRLSSLAGPESSRRMLILGSSYARGVRNTGTIFSITSLEGAVTDAGDLSVEFGARGYNVCTLVNSHFTRDDLLAEAARFLQDAESGHVRIVVFTGHAWRESDGSVMLVPPHCPNIKDAIKEVDWEGNIRKYAKPGVVVLSILAHCFGDFMTQKHDLRHWSNSIQHSVVSGPTLVTFSATSGGTAAYESRLPTEPLRATDHFIFALVSTMRTRGVCDWKSFFEEFDRNFRKMRSDASLAISVKSEGNHWRIDNPQNPHFSASSGIDFSELFRLIFAPHSD